LHAEGHRISKGLGQHFLADEALLTRIANAVGADEQALVIEIGPGPATLTALLADRSGGLVAIEFDKRLEDFHRNIFKSNERIELIYDDALRVDLWQIARSRAERWGLNRMFLAGNLPFQITSPLLFDQAQPGHPWARMTLMVQREVADRITAIPGTKDYGILTVKVAYWWKVVERFNVPASAFTPPPKVDASTLIFDPLSASESPDPSIWPGLSKFIDAAFNQRLKKLYNGLAERWKPAPEKCVIREALSQLNLNPDARAENLSPHEFLELFRRLTQANHSVSVT
ncbi:ribosomal RNA small subunit methyltransferase A, partial [Candidatus Sumerlaeota bacterium]|nr:ribosomal RNA small subunit methyltransferase A [Candidatus Sumerlaeota bacterium]